MIIKTLCPRFNMTLLIKGIKNAAVLPVPVLAIPTTSLFFKISGMAWSCMGVGIVKPRLLMLALRFSEIAKSEKVCLGSYFSCLNTGALLTTWLGSKVFIRKPPCLRAPARRGLNLLFLYILVSMKLFILKGMQVLEGKIRY